VNVEVLQWPEDQPRVAELRARGVPRLLVVRDGEPPDAPDCLEEWVSADATDHEREVRRRTVHRRAQQHGAAPSLDRDGLLHHRDHWVPLSPVEQSLAAALLDRFGAVVGRDTLALRAWPRGLPTRNALDVHVLRLRRRIAPLGLEIRTVRARGYLLQPANGANGHH
jgi:DNA-binding response OmpR family regulator